MERGFTIVLRSTVIILGVLALVMGGLGAVLPWNIGPEPTSIDYRPILIVMYAAMVPFYVSLYHALKLLRYIDKNETFSQASVETLWHIKNAAFIMGGLLMLGMLYIFNVADVADVANAPGMALFGFIVIVTTFVIATAAGVFQRLLQNAIDIKSENDLTV